MTIKKALFWGTTAVLLAYILGLIVQKSFALWSPLTSNICSNLICQWLLSAALTVISLILIGYATLVIAKYVMKPIHPIRRIFNKIFGIRMKEAKSIVLVRWGENWFYGWLTGTIERNGQTFYRVTVPSAPVPISAQLMLVPAERIMFTNMKKSTHLAQLGSLGFDALDQDLKFWAPSTENKNRGAD